ncbi:MAG: hypothetical protein LBS00_11200 [Synergistaceae bacterium]|jgi:hypothetical protein|nr:hypothetical protein [Synergistaceae bacterium]
MTRRSLIQRACVVLGLIALGACLFYIGKGHTLLIDTNAVTIDDAELRSWASATVSVDGKKLNSSMGRAERVMVDVSGPKHTIVIVNDADTDKKVEKTFRIPTFMDMAVVSVPAILGGAPAEHWVTPFTPPPAADTPVEKMQYSR